MDANLIVNSHLLPITMKDNVLDSESDFDDISIDSDVEVHDVNVLNDDFIQINLASDDNSDDKPERSIHSSNTEEAMSHVQPSKTAVRKTTTQSNRPTRRQWTVHEKLKIVDELEKGASLHYLESKYDCTRKMMREWKKNKDKLVKLVKEKGGKGKRRKRVDGAGAKLMFTKLDECLIQWYRTKRGLNQSDVNAPRDKVTFKGLVRQGQRLSAQWKSKEPSIKWYSRFMKRHRLSLQKPVRKQKISLPEAQIALEKFHEYLRHCSQLGPKRGAMGCFVELDVCNMDESPLNLWGDQSRRCINDVNTKNEIAGHLDDKRFATLILCVFPDANHRVGPVLLFRGAGNVSTVEEKQYASNIKVFFTPNAFINMATMNKYMDWWLKKVKDGNRKLFITDSCKSHLNDEMKKRMQDQGVSLAIIPKGCTQYIQLLDVHVFSAFKNHYYDCAEEFLEQHGPRSKLKLTASQKRVLCTRLTASAWDRTLTSIDFRNAFRSLGYTWCDNAVVQPSHIPWYRFDPNSVELDQSQRVENDLSPGRNEPVICLSNNVKRKQVTLKDLWKIKTT